MNNLNNIKNLSGEIKMPLLMLPLKSTLVRTSKGVILISPIKGIDSRDEGREFGDVTDIVGPNLFHHLGINSAKRMFPNAIVWGPSGFKTKRPDVRWTQLTPESWPYSGELDFLILDGMPKVQEAIFFHAESRTLIVTDLFFNFLRGSGFGYWLIFNLFGTYKRFAMSRLFLSTIKDKAAFKKSITKMMTWDFDRIVIPHGDNVESGAKTLVTRVLKERSLV
ncbi:MAG: hypothetical protein KDD25_00860 [Bdellovibrionales bacterium]|nr:hypothetical protein [Bdellovibrionales bacterium]